MSVSGSARRGRLIRAAITSVVTVLVLVLVWRLLGHGVTWHSVDLSVGSILLAAFGAACFLVGRAWRFGALLPRRDGSARELLGATAASWGVGLLLPGPSADVTFVALARTRFAVGVARGSGSAVVARILDAVSLALIAVVASFFTSYDEPAPVLLLAAGVLVVGVGVLLGMIIPGPRTVVTRLAARIPKLAGLAARAEAELDELNSRSRWANLLGSTAFCRVATVIQYTALMHMVGINLGVGQTWFVLSIRTLLLTIPIQGIAGIGTGQAWWAGALVFEGVPAELAVSAGLTLQAIDLAVSLPVAGLGSMLLFRRRKPAEPETPPVDVVGSPTPTTREPLHAG
ncbi:MAG TPA: lysylphosphatidylglycerol synthase domain-containing protein [Candidatus Dormibacteraeota bacterium]